MDIEKLMHRVVYDDIYFSVPGYFGYLSDFSKFFKIYHISDNGFYYYRIAAIDASVDNPSETF